MAATIRKPSEGSALSNGSRGKPGMTRRFRIKSAASAHSD